VAKKQIQRTPALPADTPNERNADLPEKQNVARPPDTITRSALTQVTGKGIDLPSRTKALSQKQRTEAIYRGVFNVEKGASVDPFGINVIAAGAYVSFHAPDLAKYMLCIWQLLSDQRHSSDIRNHQLVSAVEEILNAWGRFEGSEGLESYRSITNASVNFLLQSELMILGEEEYHQAVIVHPTPAGWKVIEAQRKALKTQKKRFVDEDDAWPWPSMEERLTVVVSYYAEQLGKQPRTIREWANVCGWARGTNRPDGRSQAARKSTVLKTLREKQLID